MPKKYTAGFDIGGHPGKEQDGEHYIHGEGIPFVQMEIESCGEAGVILKFSRSTTLVPFTREAALEIARDLIGSLNG